MLPDAAPIFDDALALPLAQRADLAAQLLESLDAEIPPSPTRTPADWVETINARCDEVDRGEAELIEGEQAIAMLREAARLASRPQ